ncbi:aldo/keto reductase [Mucilaginibacter polytrichastri]|uniref:NADP-dependent oxidoreductase domain-containing protein n=1 Tax=Mucilaginibacter polytrichastri TaxID=1302689 RepID=A0A1Q5ZVS2_9SPHI|nr:aldo/keto reductase [Mucilaginibacter polytrichastri]OKS85859.1 hypothetical protein RG47T_1305 [Mucilaginibacter polytrichastri]SFS61005.1 D-threo-aldose 1-dehydrogenase [Mucilaginibacter polytrichastri]
MQNVKLPKVIFGTSGLGNLYVVQSYTEKRAIVAQCLRHAELPVVFDSAGKYGAGLALESLGQCLKDLAAHPSNVLISNKLGWLRTELKTPEPTFEPGVWKDLKYDAIQKISYHGILECYNQGNELLNGYDASLVSVHDPDEYMAGAVNKVQKEERFQDILGAYVALNELKSSGKVKGIGIGSKDWRMIERVSLEVPLDWVMIANSMTVHSHPPELVVFMEQLEKKGIDIINSAVFNGGFLIGSDFYNYQAVSPESHSELYQWRARFFILCAQYQLKPAQVCAQFGLNSPGVTSIALSTTNPDRVVDNIVMASVKVPSGFWKDMKEQGLIDENYAYKYL